MKMTEESNKVKVARYLGRQSVIVIGIIVLLVNTTLMIAKFWNYDIRIPAVTFIVMAILMAASEISSAITVGKIDD